MVYNRVGWLYGLFSIQKELIQPDFDVSWEDSGDQRIFAVGLAFTQMD